MTTRDFLRLPLGKYNLTDGVGNYALEKRFSDIGTIYVITEPLSGESTILLECKNKDKHNGFECTILSAMMTVGGLILRSTDIHGIIDCLNHVPSTSFKQFVQKLNNI